MRHLPHHPQAEHGSSCTLDGKAAFERGREREGEREREWQRELQAQAEALATRCTHFYFQFQPHSAALVSCVPVLVAHFILLCIPLPRSLQGLLQSSLHSSYCFAYPSLASFRASSKLGRFLMWPSCMRQIRNKKQSCIWLVMTPRSTESIWRNTSTQ